MTLKKTSFLLVAALLSVTALSTAAQAGEYNNGYGMYNWNPFSSDAQGVYLSGQAGGSMPTDDELDTGGSYAAALGWQFSPMMRTEIEGTYRNNDYDVPGVGGDADTWSVMLNGWFDFKNETRFTPYLGGGIGWAHSNLDGSVAGIGFDESDDAFAYQVGTGVSYHVNDSVAITADYRWFDTTDFDYGAGGDEDYSAHELRAGVRYTF